MVGHFRDISAESTGIGDFDVVHLAVWIFNCIVSFTFFKIIDFFSIPGTEIVVGQTTSENPAGAFFLYGFIAVLGLVWGYLFLPETKRVVIGGD